MTAIAIRNGVEETRFSLKTTGKAYKIMLVPETDSFIAYSRELCCYDIFVADENGNLVTDGEFELECRTFNCDLLGIYSGNPKNEDRYGSDKCRTFGGKATAIISCSRPGEIQVFVNAEGLKSALDKEIVKKRL